MPTLEYNNFRYFNDQNLGYFNGMRIEFKETLPGNLYKYYSPQKHNLESITNEKLYFSHPYRFNDITDTNPYSFDFTDLSFNQYSRTFKDLKLGKGELKEMYEHDEFNGFQYYRDIFYSLLTQKIGICCFSVNEMHDLMWGHYASNSGFKIKFDTNKLIKSLNKKNENPCKIFPINYVDRKMQVSILKYSVGITLLLDFSTKVESWCYENEWRIVMTKDDMDIPNQVRNPNEPNHEGKHTRLFKFDSNCISEIVLGMNFFNGNNLESASYISNIKRSIKTEDQVLSNFLTNMIDNFSDKIYQAGIFRDSEMQFEGAHTIGRSIEQIGIEKIDDQNFTITRNKPESIRRFYKKA